MQLKIIPHPSGVGPSPHLHERTSLCRDSWEDPNRSRGGSDLHLKKEVRATTPPNPTTTNCTPYKQTTPSKY